MKIKILVAFVLFIVTFLIGSIFLIAFLKSPAFVYLYFIFSLLLLIAISASLKKKFPEEIKFVFLLIITIFVATSITIFGSSVKTYYEKNKEIGNLDINSQIKDIEAKNQYYTEYMDFLSTEILNTRQASLDLQSEIDNLIAQRLSDQKEDIIPEVIPENAPIIIYKDDELEEEDD